MKLLQIIINLMIQDLDFDIEKCANKQGKKTTTVNQGRSDNQFWNDLQSFLSKIYILVINYKFALITWRERLTSRPLSYPYISENYRL